MTNPNLFLCALILPIIILFIKAYKMLCNSCFEEDKYNYIYNNHPEQDFEEEEEEEKQQNYPEKK